MIDIHSHILWGMDDGAHSREISLAMLRVAAAAGTTDIVATPHANSQYEFQPELISERIRDLESALPDGPKIHRGCDFHLSYQNIEDALANPCKYTVNAKNFLLVEFSNLNIPGNTERILDRLMEHGMFPIITHPERNPILAKKLDQLASWVERGSLLQVTAKSLEGGFGGSAKTAGWKMLSRGIVHFVASDCHDPEYRSPRLNTAFDLVSRNISAEAARLLFITNPSVVTTGGDIGDIVPLQPQRNWSFFGFRRK